MSTIETRLRPSTFEEFVGQARMKARLNLSLDAAIAKKAVFPDTLLEGPPGSGKSTVAHLIAETLRDPLLVIPKPCTSKQLVMRLQQLGADQGSPGCGIVLFDEVHLWRTRQDELLTLVEAKTYDDGARTLRFPFITVMAATTERELVRKAFRDRFKIRCLPEPYSDREVAQIAALMARKAGIHLAEELLIGIGRAAGGVPRNAKSLILCAEEMVASGHRPQLDWLLELQGFEADGLTGEHLQYLDALNANGGRAGLGALRTRLRLSEGTVLDLEQLLVQRGMVVFDTTGRILTETGRRRIGSDPILPRLRDTAA